MMEHTRKRLPDLPARYSVIPKVLRTTTFKLALGLLLVFSFTAVCSLGYVVWKSGRLVQNQISESIEAESDNLQARFRDGGLRRLVSTMEERMSQPNPPLYLLALPNGQPFFGNIAAIPTGILDQATSREVPYTRLEHEPAPETVGETRAWVKVTLLPGGFRLLVGRDLGERMRLTRILAQAILGGLVLVIVLGFGGGLLVSHRIIARLNAMTETSRHIMAGNLDKRLPVNGSEDEFDRLAWATNTMLERITGLMQELREMTDNIAHDLKTPLTRLRNRAEEALRGTMDAATAQKALESVISDCDHMLAVFNAMLLLARLESGASTEEKSMLDMGDVVADVIELYEPVADDAGFEVVFERPEPVYVQANRELLSQAIANIMDNAMKYGRAVEGMPSCISVSLTQQSSLCRLIIADTGSGIPESDHQRALERFSRLEQSRTLSGTGLGLSLVQAIMRHHNGDVHLENNSPEGLRVVLEFPVINPESQ